MNPHVDYPYIKPLSCPMISFKSEETIVNREFINCQATKYWTKKFRILYVNIPIAYCIGLNVGQTSILFSWTLKITDKIEQIYTDENILAMDCVIVQLFTTNKTSREI